MNQNNNSLAIVQNNIEHLEGQFMALVLTNESKIVFAQESHFAMQALEKNDYLMSTAVRNQGSLKNAILNVASVGLSLNPVEKQAYLVPRDGMVCLDISYMGLVDVATQEGALTMVKAQLVHSEDQFQFNGPTEAPTHRYIPFKDRGELIGVYCVAKLPTGEYLTESMSLEECHQIRNRTDIWKKRQAGPWLTDEGEMMKKTVIKRASKLWPKPKRASRLNAAVEVLHEHEGIDFEKEREDAEKARILELEESSERRKVLADERQDLLEIITGLCGELTKGFDINQKGSFINEALGVNKFPELKNLEATALQEIIDKLKVMREELNNDGDPEQTLD